MLRHKDCPVKVKNDPQLNSHHMVKTRLTPVKTVIASPDLIPFNGYDSRHLCQIPLTLNFDMNSTFNNMTK